MTESMTNTGTPTAPKTCGLAITGFVLSLLSYLCCLGPLTGVPGAICGHVAQSRVRNSGGALGGGGLALASIIMGWLSFGMILAWFISSAMFIPAFVSSRNAAQLAASKNNARQLATACTMYAAEHDEMLPDSLENLTDAGLLEPPLPTSPFGPDNGACGYELLLRGKVSSYASPETTVLLRDRYTSSNGKRVVAYLDGHVDAVDEGME